MRISGSETVLAVDDDLIMLELVEKVLTPKGYQVLSAASGEEALEVATSHGKKIDLLLTDVMLPGIKGQDLAKLILQNYPEINVLFMSGYLCPSMAHNDSERRFEGFIQKPFSPSSLLRKVRKILD
ncbi:MAG: response regulator [Deltaproteobacteria bacterium]|jgi:CheY-like chemotaxis protein|nr:response regulator [Deltaproteobacteria bacterium]